MENSRRKKMQGLILNPEYKETSDLIKESEEGVFFRFFNGGSGNPNLYRENWALCASIQYNGKKCLGVLYPFAPKSAQFSTRENVEHFVDIYPAEGNVYDGEVSPRVGLGFQGEKIKRISSQIEAELSF
jgi:hypothetical protein